MQVMAVISQPGRPRGRGKQQVPQPSPVEATATAAGIGAILCPVSAKDVRPMLPEHMLLQWYTGAGPWLPAWHGTALVLIPGHYA